MATKLGILTTHPIQYQVPWFGKLAALAEIDLTVYFCMLPDATQQGDGFGVVFEWDIPLLEGYKYEVLANKSGNPSVTSFWGCDTPDIYDIVRHQGFDAFIVNGWVVKSCFQLLWACRKYKVPFIVRGESNSLRPRPWWKRLVHHYLLPRYSAFLNIGKTNREFYLQNGVKEEKMFYTPYCIDNDRFVSAADSLRSQRNELRAQWNILSNTCVFIFCGKFIDKKRPMDILRAMAIASQQDKDFFCRSHLLMVGDGKLRLACEQFTEKNSLPVTFSGFLNQSEIVKSYVTADCMVLPSDNGETWGLVINEGMACGLPAIVSDQVGCHPDLIRPDETGAVFPCGNITALAGLLLSFSRQPGKVKAMGEEAKKLIAGYSYDEVVRGTLKALEYVTDARHSA